MFWPESSRVKRLMFAIGLKSMYDFAHKIFLINGILFIADKVKERKRLVQRYGYQGAGIINIQ